MAPVIFCISYFSDRASCFCPGLASDLDLLTYASCKAGREVTSSCPPFYWLRWCLTNFLPCWPPTSTLPISASQVDVSLLTWPFCAIIEHKLQTS
jgi:hypothetical protein